MDDQKNTLPCDGSRPSAWERRLAPVTAAVALVYFLLDALVLPLVRPVAARLARLRLFERLGRWVAGLGPYPTLALFLVPVILLEPLKPLGFYLIGTGHALEGVVVLAVAELLKLATVERLLHAKRDTLLTIPAFAWCYRRVTAWIGWLKASRAWRAVMGRLRRIREGARRIRHALVRAWR